ADEPARTLNLEEEELDRVGGPGDLQAATGERSVGDLGMSVVGDELAGLVEAAQRSAAGALLGWRFGGPGADEIGRKAVDRDIIARAVQAASGDLGLEVAGGEAGAFPDRDRLELALEEPLGLAARPGRGGGAGGLPVFGAGQPARIGADQQLRAALAERSERGF